MVVGPLNSRSLTFWYQDDFFRTTMLVSEKWLTPSQHRLLNLLASFWEARGFQSLRKFDQHEVPELEFIRDLFVHRFFIDFDSEHGVA